MENKSESDAEIRDPDGTVYWSPEKAMEFLGVGESTLRKRTSQLWRYHPEGNKKKIYFKKDDIEELRRAPVRMIPIEPPQEKELAAAS